MNEIIKKNGINFGVILGLLSVLITAYMYVVDIKLFTSGWVTFVKVLLFGGISIYLFSKVKMEMNGMMTFKEGFTSYFIAILIGLGIATIFEIILFNYIDPSLKDTIKEMTLKYSVEILKKLGMPRAELSKAIKAIQETDQFSIGQFIKGFFIYISIASIFGLILSAIFKTKSSNQL
ncbi:MAG: DUF4199 domain-containing protein [Limnohabitans sp.]|nr:DUF4199 domain-containing protein [Limnohabitans sp.]